MKFSSLIASSKAKLISGFLNLKKIFSDEDKLDILLVWNGFKSAALIEISFLNSISKNSAKKKVQYLKHLLHRLGLRYRLRINYLQREDEVTYYSFVAKDTSTLKKLISAYAERDRKKRILKTGKILGYPSSAVRAFANRKSINIIDLPISIRKKAEFKFLNFRLSPNWRKELLYVRKIMHELKKISPDFYKKMNKKDRQFKDMPGS
jgi:hypothetical protein